VSLADAEDYAAVVVIGTSLERHQRLLELITAHAEGLGAPRDLFTPRMMGSSHTYRGHSSFQSLY